MWASVLTFPSSRSRLSLMPVTSNTIPTGREDLFLNPHILPKKEWYWSPSPACLSTTYHAPPKSEYRNWSGGLGKCCTSSSDHTSGSGNLPSKPGGRQLGLGGLIQRGGVRKPSGSCRFPAAFPNPTLSAIKLTCWSLAESWSYFSVGSELRGGGFDLFPPHPQTMAYKPGKLKEQAQW